MVVTERSQLSEAIAQMLAHDGPVLLDVHVKRDENCYPMVAPGKNNAQMIGLPQKASQPEKPQIIACSSCGTENLSTHNFCSNCGTKL